MIKSRFIACSVTIFQKMTSLHDILIDLWTFHPHLNFREEHDTIVCDIDGGASFDVLTNDNRTVNYNQIDYLTRMQKFVDVELTMMKAGFYGHCAIILPDLTVKVSPSEHSALTLIEEFPRHQTFVGRVGMEGKTNQCEFEQLHEGEFVSLMEIKEKLEIDPFL